MTRIGELVSIPSYEFDVNLNKAEYNFGLFEMRGLRPSQEDAAVAFWYSEDTFDSLKPQDIGRRLWTSYKIINQHCLQPNFGGSTASTTVYDGKGNLITATLGDSVAFAVVYGLDGHVVSVTRLNKVIHHPEADESRLAQVGGRISDGRLLGRNGSLAVSRAMGDYEYSDFGVCDDAHIDITRLADLASGPVGSIQIITTCDGFTEPIPGQTQEEHEQWLFDNLQAIQEAGTRPESELAKLLALEAFNANSQDNISVSVQTVSVSKPFLAGVYDGHGGFFTSTYIANNIGEVFEQQCNLSPKEYAQQRLSADRYFETYYRDNKDNAFYESLLAEKKNRLNELSKPNGVKEQLERFVVKKNEFVDAVILAGEEIGPPMQALLTIEDVRVFIESLCHRYVDLEIDKKELVECLAYVLKENVTFAFEQEKYKFLPFDFKSHKENAAFLKKHHGLTVLLEDLFTASHGHTVSATGLSHYSMFKEGLNVRDPEDLWNSLDELDSDPSP